MSSDFDALAAALAAPWEPPEAPANARRGRGRPPIRFPQIKARKRTIGRREITAEVLKALTEKCGEWDRWQAKGRAQCARASRLSVVQSIAQQRRDSFRDYVLEMAHLKAASLAALLFRTGRGGGAAVITLRRDIAAIRKET